MLSDEVLDKVIERLTNRIEQGNEYILTKIGNKIDEIGKLQPTQAIQLQQIIKYGGDYNKIVKKLAKITKLNKKDIEKIFKEVAKSNHQFAKKFYDYRNIKYIPYDDNAPLKKQVEALAKITNDKYTEIARSKALGFSVRNKKGKVIFKGLKEVYDEAIDKAVMSIAQGKTTFNDEMYKFLKQIGESGVKTLDYNGRTMRLDSAFRMHINDALMQLHNEQVITEAEAYDSDGVEISVHLFPAPDHELVQGRQFRDDEFKNFQNDKTATSIDGIEFPPTSEETGYDRRSISQYNCKHKVFPIVIGVSSPTYTNEQLQKIIDDNNKGFEFEGKHYTNYEGTQLQRQIETAIRKNKDLQILGRTSNNEKLAQESQVKINQLTKKYKDLSKASGLSTYADRLRVSGYKAIKVNETPTIKANNKDIIKNLKELNINVSNDLFNENMDKELMDKSLNQLEKLVNKYPVLKDKIKEDGLLVETNYSYNDFAGKTNITGEKLTLSTELYKDRKELISQIKEGQDDNWSAKVYEKNYDIYNITHETGHIIEDAIMKYRIKKEYNVDVNKLEWSSDALRYQRQLDVDMFNEIFLPVSDKTNISWLDLQEKYISDYGRSTMWFEWFAELFTKMELGEEDIMTERLKEYLEKELWK